MVAEREIQPNAEKPGRTSLCAKTSGGSSGGFLKRVMRVVESCVEQEDANEAEAQNGQRNVPPANRCGDDQFPLSGFQHDVQH